MFYCGEESGLVPRTCVQMITSALGLGPLSGSCICACIALRFPGENLNGEVVKVSFIKVTMSELCARLFIIIFMMNTPKSEYIPTVTNFASILANCLYFLQEIMNATMYREAGTCLQVY